MSGHIYVIGMPGSGKTEVGTLVAHTLKRPFVDVDAAVEQEAGLGAADLFADEGEAGFRARERAMLERLAGQAALEPSVVACGGGTVIDPANRATMKGSGTVVWLQVDAQTVLERVPLDGSRPLLREPGDVDRLLGEREPLYREAADVTVDGAGMPEAVAVAVVEAL